MATILPKASLPPATTAAVASSTTNSALLGKAVRLGLELPTDLDMLAVLRGLRYYDLRNERHLWRDEQRLRVPESDFSNGELAIALLSPVLMHGDGCARLHRQRLAGALLGDRANQADEIAALARAENCAGMVRHIAQCGRDVEPDEAFWATLAEALRDAPEPEGNVPHITRLIEMTGITRGKVGIQRRWLRPHIASPTV